MKPKNIQNLPQSDAAESKNVLENGGTNMSRVENQQDTVIQDTGKTPSPEDGYREDDTSSFHADEPAVQAGYYTTVPFLVEQTYPVYESHEPDYRLFLQSMTEQSRDQNYYGRGYHIVHSRGRIDLGKRKEKIESIIKEYLTSPDFNVTSLVDMMFMDRGTLFRSIKRLYSMSPSILIRTRRVEQAGILIRTSSHSLAKIAELSGFKSLAELREAILTTQHCTLTEFCRKMK